jgi:hypothetical protein
VESLLQSARRREDGEALPTVFKTLADKGFHFYRGSLYITAAAPNVGKSPFALCHMLGMPDVPCLYICADTPRHITVVRAAQTLTSSRQDEVEAALEEEDSSEVWQQLEKANHIGAFFRSGISAKEVALMIGAFAEIKGEFPHYVVIDNLVNIAYEGDSELQAQRQILHELDTIAKDANICIHILTHVSGDYKRGTVPIPQDGVMNKVSEYPHGIITMTRSTCETEVLLAIVKNRTSTADPSGNTRFSLHADFSRMDMRDPMVPTTVTSTPDRNVPYAFPASYTGECHECNDFIDVGDMIVINGGVFHEQCA